MSELHISLAAEKLGTVFGIPVTNSILMTWLCMIFITFAAYLSTRKISLVPSKLQVTAEMIVDGLHSLFKSVVGEELIEKLFPLLATIFLFVIVLNWAELLPIVGPVGIREGTEFIPLLRAPNADLNTTIALALFSVFSIQFFGFRSLGIHYLKKFFNTQDPIMFGVGLLEIVSEISRIISFAFRLFGNIFAGEVLLTVIAFLIPVIAPLPFYGLELFVGFIQALIFSMLTAVFVNMATIPHESH